MEPHDHFKALERMYLSAPINTVVFQPAITVSQGEARITLAVEERFYHAAGAVHGAVYFKLLDDAAFFAANSLEPEFFVLTTAFTTYLTRPVSQGKLVSTGRVVNRNRSQFVAESVVVDGEGREIGRGSGLFVRGKTPLLGVPGYGPA